MSNCISYNCDELEEHLLNDCEEEIQGGFPSLVILDCGHEVTDPSNGDQIEAAIAAGKAVVVKNVKFGLDARSPIQIDSNIACRPQKLVNYDNTASLIDGNVNNQNMAFYESLFGGRAIAGIIALNCATGKVWWYNNSMYATGSLIQPNTDDEFMRYEGSFAWKGKSLPLQYTAPAGIFD
jgi:hypothetical protein